MTCIDNIDQMLVKMMIESKKTPNFSRNFEKQNLVRLRSKQKFSQIIASNYIMSYMVGKLGFPSFLVMLPI